MRARTAFGVLVAMILTLLLMGGKKGWFQEPRTWIASGHKYYHGVHKVQPFLLLRNICADKVQWNLFQLRNCTEGASSHQRKTHFRMVVFEARILETCFCRMCGWACRKYTEP